MMLVEAIEQRLRGADETNTPVAGRIGTSRRLAAMPAFVIQIVADPRPQHFKGFQRVRPTTVQVDAWARTQAEADMLGAAAIAVLTPAVLVGSVRFQRAMIGSTRSGPEMERGAAGQRPQAERFYHSTDFIFTHNAT